MNRGSVVGQQKIPLPWNCFNEAPIHESGKLTEQDYLATNEAASMRPRFMNRGSHLHGVIHEERYAASMRPRFMNRGSGECREYERLFESSASMRPRFMNRGSGHADRP